MWKILTVINSLIILAILGFGIFLFQNGYFDILTKSDSREKLDDVILKVEEISSNFTAVDDIASSEDASDIPAGTLTEMADGTLKGFADLSGYLNSSDTGPSYFVFNSSSDDTLTDYLSGDTSLNKKTDGRFMLPLGCDNGKSLETQMYTISGNSYDLLKKSSKTSPIKVRAFFGKESFAPSTDTCFSQTSNLQVLAE